MTRFDFTRLGVLFLVVVACGQSAIADEASCKKKIGAVLSAIDSLKSEAISSRSKKLWAVIEIQAEVDSAFCNETVQYISALKPGAKLRALKDIDLLYLTKRSAAAFFADNGRFSTWGQLSWSVGSSLLDAGFQLMGPGPVCVLDIGILDPRIPKRLAPQTVTKLVSARVVDSSASRDGFYDHVELAFANGLEMDCFTVPAIGGAAIPDMTLTNANGILGNMFQIEP